MAQRRKWRVVITGASAGVGRATAHRFAQTGASIGLIARDERALNDVKAEVEELGGIGFVASADVADPAAVFAAAEKIERRLGPIEIWINNAMVTVFSPVWQITPEEFRRITEVTYLGAVHGTMAALKRMRRRNRGMIIQVGSALAYRGIPLQAGYCGAKHAIRGFTDSLRAELIHAGSAIKLIIVELPAVNTPQFDWARTHMPREPRPVPPVVQPEVIADAIFRAAVRPDREYWVGWSTLKVIIGNMVFPRWLDRYLARTTYEGQETRLPVAPRRSDNLVKPVHQLHRTHGRFDAEAACSAIVLPGPMVRVAPVVAGAILLFGLGLLGSRIAANKRPY